jgi:hypothetical protein
MIEILKQPTEAQKAQAAQENLYALFRAMAMLPGSQLIEGPTLSYHLASPTNPMFKGVWATHLAPEEADEAIAETLAWFKERNAPYLFWWDGPGIEPDDLGRRLEAHGLISFEGQAQEFAPGIHSSNFGAPAMIADLHELNEAALETVPANFVIEEVQDEAALAAFKQVFIESYEVPEWAAQAWVEATRTLGIGRTPWRMYLGRLNGTPVATNMLIPGGGVAGVIAVGTVPNARGKGIGGAITLKPLLDGREMGYRYGALFSTQMGYRVYERLGFRDTGARINRYLWRNNTL